MNRRQDALVLLLAGGVGSRLNILVQSRAKPAVPFGGLYRIIDFSLSNVMNSGLTRVGVLTQYKPLSLMKHIGTGGAWDFTGRSRGVKILPPRTGFKDSDWYKGTADAVRQNIDFLEANPADEVILLSGDHIYHMDFHAMLEYHRHKQADVTVAMMVVPRSEMYQFGAGIIDARNRIIDWEEKPKNPRTNLASMGIYVFNRRYLLDTLARDRDEADFGIHILPWAIENDNVFPMRSNMIMFLPIHFMAIGGMWGRSRPIGRPIWISSGRTAEFHRRSGEYGVMSRLKSGGPTGRRPVTGLKPWSGGP